MVKRITLLILCFNILEVFACYWDFDTIKMERQQFPSVIELISGKFLRHSPEYYYWRIKDREQRIRKSPDSLSLYDDLAVSYSKIGNDKKAIEIITKKDSIAPGLYETYANLGTFYIHNRQFEKGLEYIDKAIEINPNAHFGRERYQRDLVAYVISKRENGKLSYPLDQEFAKSPTEQYYFPMQRPNNFYTYVLDQYKESLDSVERVNCTKLPKAELDKAIIGVMGMMKFGNYNSPILLEVLGDLLMNEGKETAARQLAARAYFKASYRMRDRNIKDIYLKKITYILHHQLNNRRGKQFGFPELEKLLKEEILEGESYYKQVREDEINWIKSGANPEKEFVSKYYSEPAISERIQTANEDFKMLERRYIADTTIGKNIDYKVVIDNRPVIDSTHAASIDSLFDQQDDKAAEGTGEMTQNEKQTGNFALYAILSIVFSLIVVWFIIRRRKRVMSSKIVGDFSDLGS